MPPVLALDRQEALDLSSERTNVASSRAACQEELRNTSTDNLQKLIGQLNEGAPETRKVSVRAIAALGDKVLPELEHTLTAAGTTWLQRTQIIGTIRQIGTQPAVELLKKISNDSRFNEIHRTMALRNLAELGERFARAPLFDIAMDAPGPEVASIAMEGLSNFSEKAVVNFFLDALKVRDKALDAEQALLKIGAPAVSGLEEMAKTGTEDEQWAALRILGHMGRPEATERIIDFAKKAFSEKTWEEAIDALGCIKDPKSVAFLVSQLGDRQIGAMAKEAVGKLGQYGVETLVAFASGKQPDAPDNASIVKGFQAIGPSILPQAMAAVRTRSDKYPDISLLDGIAGLGKGATPALRELYEKGGIEEKNIAVYCMGRGGDATAIPLVREALKVGDIGLVGLSIDALGRLADKGSVGTLRDFVKSNNPATSQMATLALGRLKVTDALPKLIEMYEARESGEIVLDPDEIAAAIGNMPGPEPLTFLKKASGDPRALYDLLDSYSGRSDRDSIVALADILKQYQAADFPAGQKSISILGKKDSPEALAAIFEASRSGNEWVRQTASETVREIMERDTRKFIELCRQIPGQDAAYWRKRFEPALALGIDKPFLFSEEALREIVANRLAAKPDGRPLAIVTYPKSDKNNAFALHGLDFVEDLMKKGYRVMFYQIGSRQDLASSLKGAVGVGDQRQRADLIVLAGHGNQRSIEFNSDLPEKERSLTIDDAGWLLESGVSEVLADGGSILLHACSTGANGTGAKNIANMLRIAFPHAGKGRIIAPMADEEGVQQLLYDEDGRVNGAKFGNVRDEEVYQARLEGSQNVPS